MNGKRLPDGTPPREPGEYAWMPYADWEYRPPFFLGEGEWHIMDPTGGVGAACRHWRETNADGQTIEHPPAHTCVIHDDGTVTFSPSLVMPGGWHGFLVAGIFS